VQLPILQAIFLAFRRIRGISRPFNA
jgi:hypothetical protein